MGEALTLVGIEVPRSPQLRSRGNHGGSGEWEVAGQRLLERTVEAMAKVAGERGLTLISGEPDQAVFDTVQRYGAAEADLMTWIQGVTSRAREATRDDVVVFMRSDVVLKDYTVVAKAIEVIRAIDDVHRVEVAYRPKRQPLERAFAVDIGRDGMMVEERLSLPKGELGQVCPAFEAHRLSNFNVSSLQAPALSGSAFLWVDEHDFVVLETPLDYLRAELMLREAR